MEKIISIIKAAGSPEDNFLPAMLDLLVNGTNQEKILSLTIMNTLKRLSQASANRLVDAYIEASPQNFKEFRQVCQILDVPEQNAIKLLQIKGVLKGNAPEDKEEPTEMPEGLKSFIKDLEDMFSRK